MFRAAVGSHPRRVWVLYLIGAIAILSLAEVEPSILIYLADPEVLAAIVAGAGWMLRRHGQRSVGWVTAVALPTIRRAASDFYWTLRLTEFIIANPGALLATPR